MAGKRKHKQTPGLWVRIHDRIWQDDRVLDLAMRGDRGVAAVGVFVMSVAWAHHSRRDGDLPRGCLPLIHGKKHHADLLVSVGLWESTKTGWRIPRYDDWQDTVEEIEATKRAQSTGGKVGACSRWHPQPCNLPECHAAPQNVIPITPEEARNG